MGRLKGIVDPLVQPLKSLEGLNRIDEASTANLVEHVIVGGVDAVFALGNTGEFQYLTSDEKGIVARTVSDAASKTNPEIPVYVGITGKTEEETRQNILSMRALADKGYKIDALVLAPLMHHHNRGLPQYIKGLAQLTDIPFILYNNPALVPSGESRRKNIRTGIFKEIAQYEHVLGIKDSSDDISRLEHYIKAAHGNCAVLQGSERKALLGLTRGADGLVPSLANVYPELFAHLYRAFNDPDALPHSTQEQITTRAIRVYRNFKNIPGGLKTALVEMDLIKTDLTLAGPPLIENDKKSIRSTIQEIYPAYSS